jgi:hypothetical protein
LNGASKVGFKATEHVGKGAASRRQLFNVARKWAAILYFPHGITKGLGPLEKPQYLGPLLAWQCGRVSMYQI